MCLLQINPFAFISCFAEFKTETSLLLSCRKPPLQVWFWVWIQNIDGTGNEKKWDQWYYWCFFFQKLLWCCWVIKLFGFDSKPHRKSNPFFPPQSITLYNPLILPRLASSELWPLRIFQFLWVFFSLSMSFFLCQVEIEQKKSLSEDLKGEDTANLSECAIQWRNISVQVPRGVVKLTDLEERTCRFWYFSFKSMEYYF